MMTVYIDKGYKCHANQADGLTAIETDFFDGKCTAYIEGFRFVPADQMWTNPNGITYAGEMVTPWKPFNELEAVQREYEHEQFESVVNDLEANAADYAAAYEEGVQNA